MEKIEIKENANKIFEAWKAGVEVSGETEYKKIVNKNQLPLYAILEIVREFRKLTIKP